MPTRGCVLHRRLHLGGIGLVVAAMLAILALPRRAEAQTPSPLAEWQYSAGVPLEKLYQKQLPKWQIELGIAATFEPIYDGSQRYRVLGGPSVYVAYRDLLFASTGEGIGVNILRGKHYRVGVALTYELGRRMADYDSRLHGLGNIYPAPEAKLFAEYAVSKQFPLVLRADLRRVLGGSNGWIGDLGAYLPLPGSSKRFYWFAGPTLTFADARYMNTWFGVDAEQAAASGYAQHDAGAGLRSFGFGLSAVWAFRPHWLLNGDVALEQLVGGAANSPIVESASNGVFDISVLYQF